MQFYLSDALTPAQITANLDNTNVTNLLGSYDLNRLGFKQSKEKTPKTQKCPSFTVVSLRQTMLGWLQVRIEVLQQ